MSIQAVLEEVIKPVVQKLEAFETEFTLIKSELATLRRLLELRQIKDRKDKETYQIRNLIPPKKVEIPKETSSGRTFSELVLKGLEKKNQEIEAALTRLKLLEREEDEEG